VNFQGTEVPSAIGGIGDVTNENNINWDPILVEQNGLLTANGSR
jgi:hypothetical protein